MPIADVLSRVATIQQLADVSRAPAAPSTSFADALAAVDPTSTPGAASQLAEEAGLGSPTGSAQSAAALAAATLGASTLDDAGSSSTPGPLALLGGTSVPAYLTSAFQTSPAATTFPDGSTAGQRALAAAESQVGVAEQPPGSNDGPQLGTYRSAVAGAQPGEPWCAYFASWSAAQAGAPLGANGQGLGSVSEITDWAASTGRLLPAGSTPQPGDLILFGDRHVGLVESVNPDGSLTTVEGNYANAVSRVTRSPVEATGYVRL
jgi:CHAP domain-containing protein